MEFLFQNQHARYIHDLHLKKYRIKHYIQLKSESETVKAEIID